MGARHVTVEGRARTGESGSEEQVDIAFGRLVW